MADWALQTKFLPSLSHNFSFVTRKRGLLRNLCCFCIEREKKNLKQICAVFVLREKIIFFVVVLFVLKNCNILCIIHLVFSYLLIYLIFFYSCFICFLRVLCRILKQNSFSTMWTEEREQEKYPKGLKSETVMMYLF